ncbi:hypothetical protein [Flavobacterium pedocola]
MKNFLGIKLLLLLLFSCNEKSSEKDALTSKETDSTILISNDTVETLQKTNEKWSLVITKIDSIAFEANKQQAKPQKEKPEKITDFQVAKRMLEGRVRFGDWDDANQKIVFNDTGIMVAEIMDVKTKKLKGLDDFFDFIAYYPSLDILLCEGGHTTDVSFNLTTGEETETTGNPDYIVSSKSKKIRLNMYFEGQECYASFIQKEINGKFEKIIELDQEFKKITKLLLCTIGDSFWLNDTTLFLEETDNPDENNNPISYYYKIEILKN